MKDHLLELYGHQAWADAELLNAVEAHAPALNDRSIRDRLHHIYQTQNAFLSIARGEPIDITHLEEQPDVPVFKDRMKQYHAKALNFLRDVSEAQLERIISIPWFKDPPITITIAQALTQAAMHSHYHRGQNASKLRELGGQPPITDLILWYWKGRPEPHWT